MNTVMDDNKVLTLVSNERVPLLDAMRMVFEINSLKNATPATVSRAGILFINETDVGWRPIVETWVQSREDDVERNHLPALFDKYVEATADMTRKGYKEATTIRIINKVATTIYLLEGLLPKMAPESKDPERLELVFVYALTWAFGGADGNATSRATAASSFSEDFAALFGAKYPKEGQCFDYFYDPATNQHVHWQERVLEVHARADRRQGHRVALHQAQRRHGRHVPHALDHVDSSSRTRGTSCSSARRARARRRRSPSFLRSLDKDTDGLLSVNVVMSYFTDSLQLQAEMEARDRQALGPHVRPARGQAPRVFRRRHEPALH